MYKAKEKRPLFPAAVLIIILAGCMFCDVFVTSDPAYMDLYNVSSPPGRENFFGTDTMGRDIFSMIWYGGRVSLIIGFLSAAISAVIAVIAGSVSGLCPQWLDNAIMRFTDIFLSVPSLLLIIFIQAALGPAGVVSISFVTGITSWPAMAKVVRTEVKQLNRSEFVIASRCMGGSFFHILTVHMIPNLLPSIMFMIVMNIRNAIVAESTLSFMGTGLPLDIISWGSMLSLAGNSLFSGCWWIVLIPGAFLTITLMCVTAIAGYMKDSLSHRHSNI